MKNISFDNPYLLLIAIPVILAIMIPYFIVRNKDNKSSTWIVSLFIHAAITVLVTLALAGLAKTTLLTETSIYVVADVSHSSERNLDKIFNAFASDPLVTCGMEDARKMFDEMVENTKKYLTDYNI